MAQFSLQMGDVSHMNLVLYVAYGQAELNRNLWWCHHHSHNATLTDTAQFSQCPAKQKLGEGKLGSRAWRPAFDAAICPSAIITLIQKTISLKKKKKKKKPPWIMFEPHPCYNLGTRLICGYFMKDSLHIIQCRSPEVGFSASLHMIA